VAGTDESDDRVGEGGMEVFGVGVGVQGVCAEACACYGWCRAPGLPYMA
jgi:hypothetical protein